MACISSITNISLPLSIEVCLLSLIDSLVTTKAILPLLTLLFYARKIIILSWKKHQHHLYRHGNAL